MQELEAFKCCDEFLTMNEVFMSLIDDAKRALEVGQEFPYGDTAGGDWAKKAANGILYDLCDRRGIKHAFNDVDEDIRSEIIDALAEIIRQAEASLNNA